MNKEELENYIKTTIPKLIIDKVTCKTVSAYGSIDVDELTSAIDRLKKVPNYDELLKENNRLNKALLNIKEKMEQDVDFNDDECSNEYKIGVRDEAKETLWLVNQALGDKENE